MKREKKVFIVLGVIVVIVLISGVVAYHKINNIKNVQLNVPNSELNVSQETAEKSKEQNIENILLLGIDKQENASDAIIVLSVDKKNNDINMTSIQRDSRVYFGEQRANKINYAYNYGGVELSIQKVNELYDLDIKKYVKVTFDELIKSIDYLGGVEIEITNDELKFINSYIDNINKLQNTNYSKIKSPGKQHLNGTQALAYCRIRYTEGGDAKRTERQRIVLLELFKKIKEVEPIKYPQVIADLSATVETNLSTFDILSLGQIALTRDASEIKELRLPLDGTITHINDPGYNLGWERESNVKALHKFIYGE